MPSQAAKLTLLAWGLMSLLVLLRWPTRLAGTHPVRELLDR